MLPSVAFLFCPVRLGAVNGGGGIDKGRGRSHYPSGDAEPHFVTHRNWGQNSQMDKTQDQPFGHSKNTNLSVNSVPRAVPSLSPIGKHTPVMRDTPILPPGKTKAVQQTESNNGEVWPRGDCLKGFEKLSLSLTCTLRPERERLTELVVTVIVLRRYPDLEKGGFLLVRHRLSISPGW